MARILIVEGAVINAALSGGTRAAVIAAFKTKYGIA